jgi:alpha-galactosidase
MAATAALVAVAFPVGMAAAADLRPVPPGGGVAPSSVPTPMGWTSSGRLGSNVTESDIVNASDAIAGSGLQAAGYQYVVLGDGWMAATRALDGSLVADPVRFPGGIKALVDHAHGFGMKFGITASPGTTTCAGGPGSSGHEDQDARTFATWGVDYVQYDGCGYTSRRPANVSPRQWGIDGFAPMRRALQATGRSIVFAIDASSTGEPSADAPWTWGREVADVVRVAPARAPCWRSTVSSKGPTPVCVADRLDAATSWLPSSSDGHWNDLGPLAVGLDGTALPALLDRARAATGGVAGLDDTEARSQLSIWAMLGSPLVVANDVTSLGDATKALLTNGRVLAVAQDGPGRPATLLPRDDRLVVWTRELAGGDRVVLAVNPGDARVRGTVTAKEASLGSGHPRTVDLWSGATSTVEDGGLQLSLAPHAVAMYRVTTTPKRSRIPTVLSVGGGAAVLAAAVAVRRRRQGRTAGPTTSAAPNTPAAGPGGVRPGWRGSRTRRGGR